MLLHSMFTFHTDRHLHYGKQKPPVFSPGEALTEAPGAEKKQDKKSQHQRHKIMHPSLNMTPVERKISRRPPQQSPGVCGDSQPPAGSRHFKQQAQHRSGLTLKIQNATAVIIDRHMFVQNIWHNSSRSHDLMQEAAGKRAQVCGNGCQSIKHESINQKNFS